ncbi:MAG: hypothetical protein C4547_11245 [Phycisphaerales bacterium]|nr:MAG: hypothetical protein C4547_11245 [Phycisphaerales bacterium]
MALALGSPVLWVLTLSNGFLQRTGLAMWAGAAAGTILVAAAVRRDRRLRTRVVAGVDAAWILLLAAGFIWGTRLPAAPGFAAATQVPALTLPDHQGRPTAMTDLTAHGAALLVFYRGHW